MLSRLVGAGKTPMGWEELLLVTGAAAGFSQTVIETWKDDTSALSKATARGHRVVNANDTAYYVGYTGARPTKTWTIADMYLDIAAGLSDKQRALVHGGHCH